MFDTRVILKLVIFSGDDLSLSSWWRILALKLSVSGIMGLVSYMATDAKRAMRLNNLGLPSPFLYISCFFCFALVLKCRCLYIMGLSRRTVNSGCALVRLDKP